MGISIGPISIPILDVILCLLGLHKDSFAAVIILNIRLPRVLVSALAGACLALAGCLTQATFRNPLASPYILGLSYGATFVLSIAIVYLDAPFAFLPIFAFLGSLLAISLVFAIAGSSWDTAALILAGIAISAFFSSLTSLILYFAGAKAYVIIFWIFGGLTGVSWNVFWVVFLGSLPILIAVAGLAGKLNILMLGDDIASSLGLDVNNIRLLAIILASLLTAIVVSYLGPIGFVGLIVPHICRIIVGSDNRFLIPASAMFGASFLTLVDLIARTAIAPAELPLGAIIGVMGSPYFAYLVRNRRRLLW